MTKNYRDARTGQYTTAADAAARPAETVSETVPTRHETPDVAELRRLAEDATPGPWTFEAPERREVHIEREGCICAGDSDEYEFVSENADHHVHLWHESHIIYAGEKVVAGNYDYEDGGIVERRDRDYIAAASPDVVVGLLDRLAHMTEARDNARAEVERLTGKLAAIEADDDDKLSIMSGWLVYDVGEHTCGGYGPESGYVHEPGCGFEPVLRLDKLQGWPEVERLAGLVEAVREWATDCATQATDYDEDTEQQIEDGREVLRILDGAES